jgi:hypothetical protein
MSLVSITAWILLAAVCVVALTIGRRSASWRRATTHAVVAAAFVSLPMLVLISINSQSLVAHFCGLGRKLTAGEAPVHVEAPFAPCGLKQALFHVGASPAIDMQFVPAIIGAALIVVVLAIRWAADGPDD